jgi:hypothetical protein
MPFVDYQKNDVVKEKQEVLLEWAQLQGPQLPGVGDKVTQLMQLYKEAQQLHAQLPRKKVSLQAAMFVACWLRACEASACL